MDEEVKTENAKLRADIEMLRKLGEEKDRAFHALQNKRDALLDTVGEQARAIRNVQRALKRNENREINMGEAWALIQEAVAEKQNSNACANAENVGPTALGDPKCNCNWIPHLYDCPVVLAQEPRYCVKCGRRVEAADAAHVFTCEGKGNPVNPAPFIG